MLDAGMQSGSAATQDFSFTKSVSEMPGIMKMVWQIVVEPNVLLPHSRMRFSGEANPRPTTQQ
jgi:hypothetical protein